MEVSNIKAGAGNGPRRSVGERFTPYGMFCGSFIPEGVQRIPNSELSSNAKLVYGRMARYAGKDGACYPSLETLGKENGLSEAQARRCVRELENWRLIEVDRQNHGKTNRYFFLWHSILDTPTPITGDTHTPITHDTPTPITGDTRRESSEENQFEENQKPNTDLDYATKNRTNSDSPSHSPGVSRFPRLREALANYFDEPGQEHIYPTERLLQDCMYWAGGATEEALVDYLRFLREDRGLRPGTKSGPRHWAWFKEIAKEFGERHRFGVPTLAPSAELTEDEFAQSTEILGE